MPPLARRHTSTAAALLVALLLISMAVLRITGAAFSATTEGTSGWSAGSVTVGDDDAGVAMFDSGTDGLLDGDQTLTRCIAVTYSGTITTDVAVRLYATTAGTLAPHLNTTIEEGTGGGAGTCTGFSATSTLYTGTLSAFSATHSTRATGVSAWAPTSNPETRTYRFTITVANTTAAQSKSATATFTWEGATVAPIVYANTVMEDNPLLYWGFGETSGPTAADKSGNNRTGTYNDMPGSFSTASLVGPPSDTAALFDGSSSFVKAPSPGVIGGQSFTAEAWIKPTRVTGSNTIIGRLSGGNIIFMLRVNEGQIDFPSWNGGFTNLFASTPIVAGQTYHVVATYDQATATKRIYINGTPDGSTVTGIEAYNPPITVGSNDVGSERFAGTIDEVVFYGTALSAARVAAHYQAGLGL